jgi:hypothetical protein
MRKSSKFNLCFADRNGAKCGSFVLYVSILVSITFSFSLSANSQSIEPELADLRHRFAANYLNPEAHFALAQYYLNKQQAFFIMEYARKRRFSEDQFNTSFVKFFGDNSPEPSDAAKDAFENAYELLKAQKIDAAEHSFLKAAELAPKSGMINSWVGRFFYKAKNDSVQALKFYFISYFLDPHAYETEYVESRILKISVADADTKFVELLKSGKSLAEISTDANPVIVARAITEMAKAWDKGYLKPLLDCLKNDDSLVRWLAFLTVLTAKDTNSEEIISILLESKDLRLQGLAAYAIVKFWKEKSFETIKKMLGDKAELIRFDAISALIQGGGSEGIKIVRAHQKVETSPYLILMIEREVSKAD